MYLVMPRLTGDTRAGPQHVITAECSRGRRRGPAVMTSHGPADLATATLFRAAPSPIEQEPSTTKADIMSCGSRASVAARPLKLHPGRRVTGVAQRIAA